MVGIGELRPARGSRRRQRRIGRGGSSGRGNTAGRGNKGQKARSGGQTRPGFEGGQLPLVKRVPYRRGVRGAGSVMTGGGPRPRMGIVNIGRLSIFPPGTEVTPDALKQARLVQEDRVKILGTGEVPHALVVKAHAFSKTARTRIEAAGGQVQVLS
ncbi:MAG TPA: 50S ribosomal protein L15 [bacterium]|jgi:large subunit ribosomal protein L15|nr:50S ribosomal protein L15 [bacterium]